MKKNIIYYFLIVLCFTTGCKKDQNSGINKIYLLKQKVIHYSFIGGVNDTSNFTYDDKNRLITVVDGSGQNQITLKLIYDSNNRVIQSIKYNASGAQQYKFAFIYTQGAVSYLYYDHTNPPDTADLTFNSKNQVIKIQTHNSGSQRFTYDSGGNVLTNEVFLADGSNNLTNETVYYYDNRKNPFASQPADNYYLRYLAYLDASTFINNVILRNSDTFSYTYNADGYPVTGTLKNGKYIIPMDYVYTVK